MKHPPGGYPFPAPLLGARSRQPSRTQGDRAPPRPDLPFVITRCTLVDHLPFHPRSPPLLALLARFHSLLGLLASFLTLFAGSRTWNTPSPPVGPGLGVQDPRSPTPLTFRHPDRSPSRRSVPGALGALRSLRSHLWRRAFRHPTTGAPSASRPKNPAQAVSGQPAPIWGRAGQRQLPLHPPRLTYPPSAAAPRWPVDLHRGPPQH